MRTTSSGHPARAKVVLAKTDEELAAAKRVLHAETAKLHKAQLAESNATQELTKKTNLHRTALMQYNVATQANTAAQKANAAATTFAGRAHLVFSNSVKAAKAAVAGLYATLGPVGVIMVALSAGYAAATYLNDKWKKSIEGAVSISESELAALKEKEEQLRKVRDEEAVSVSRLEELASYTRLSSSEQHEAETIIKRLTERYHDFSVEIDENTGKLKINAEALAAMNKQQLEDEAKNALHVVQASMKNVSDRLTLLRSELGDYWTDFFGGLGTITGIRYLVGNGDPLSNESQMDIDFMMDNSAERQLSKLQAMKDEYVMKGKAEEVEKINAVIKAVEDQIEAEKRLAEINERLRNNTPGGATGSNGGGDTLSQQSKAEREAITAIEETELKIRMKHADNEGKIRELNKQIADLFEKFAPGNFATVEEFIAGDRYSMNDDALKALNQILQLKEQILDIDKASNDEIAKFQDKLDKAYKAYGNLLASREEKQRNEALTRDIDSRIESGDRSGALDIARQQLAAAEASVEHLRSQYEYQMEIARGTGVLDNDKINELRSMLESAFSDVDKWQSRIDSINKKEEKKERENIRTVGGWSAELLSAQILGTNTAQAQTAKYTKQSADHLRNIDEEISTYGVYDA